MCACAHWHSNCDHSLTVIFRIYALYERNKKLALALLLYILAQMGVSLWIDILPSVRRGMSLLADTAMILMVIFL